MKFTIASLFASLIVLSGCTSETENKVEVEEPVAVEKETAPATRDTILQKDTPVVNTFSNQRFKNVSVAKLGENRYRITGKGQIFEASFGWVIEDGHDELKKGFSTTDAGAPEWGNFDFEVQAMKKRPNSTLHLIIFETSAKDGSRQYELPIPLPE